MMLLQTGEFLSVSGPDLRLKPVLAESWKPNEDGTVWTFKIRKGVKFHNGNEMKADDVVASIDRLADPKNASNALSAFKGTLSKGGTQKVDDYTVAFHLDAPNGNFPYIVSSDNYNAIIIPADYAGDFEKNFIGTGPFKLEKYTPKVGASFTRFDGYWGPKALPDRTEWIFYQDLQAGVLALQGNLVDVITQVPVQGGQALLNDPNIRIISERTSAHQQVHMRCDMAPLDDARVRRAIALCLDREKMVKGLFRGRSDIGNDSPFAPVFPSTDSAIPQRKKDLRQAKELLAAAGHPDGFTVKLTTERYLEIPDYAVIIQNAVKPIGINIELNVEAQDAYYGKATFGQSDWLEFDHGDHRLRPSRRAECVPQCAAQERRHLELGAFQEQGLRCPRRPICAGPRSRQPAGSGRQDPAPPAGRDADHLRLFLQLPDSGEEESPGHSQRAEPPVPLSGAFHLGLPRSIAGGSAAGDFFFRWTKTLPSRRAVVSR